MHLFLNLSIEVCFRADVQSQKIKTYILSNGGLKWLVS